ncbi:hypothetical protein, partial [Catenulispora rubra]|uniref:hypothetical protein n=1 Tax=Catenulispora rubra TaxID=280293 RepID=UPI001E56CE0D
MAGLDALVDHPVHVDRRLDPPGGPGLLLSGGLGVVEALQHLQFHRAARGEDGPFGGIGRPAARYAVLARGA